MRVVGDVTLDLSLTQLGVIVNCLQRLNWDDVACEIIEAVEKQLSAEFFEVWLMEHDIIYF